MPTAISSTNKCEFEHVNLSLYKLILIYNLAVSQCLHSQILLRGYVSAKNCFQYSGYPILILLLVSLRKLVLICPYL